MTTRRDRIVAALTGAFAPTRLSVVDESHLHEGHGGWRESGETHFRVAIAAPAFAGKTRLARHRMVNETLAPEFAAGLHALAIEAGEA
ncbi:BolA family protein [Methylobrevis pamukkalensis]|uniref:Transcriptional regulator BolA n=1 Tax=Methylobrevis pamukkalensis TaxID=1439726 RepID=A0A1E3H0K9_9HYPH|nr:BolA family protein [Methylobrevis pamukkalensis]ODN69863.1 transcriptional regulator BolA [Methylobrevis pamukkalensis]